LLTVLAACYFALVGWAQPPATFKIAGQVVHHPGNRPVRAARVSIIMVEHPDRTLTAVSGENGEFSFFGLPAAKYQLRVEYRGTARLYRQTDEFSTAIVVGAGLDSEHIVFPLESPASISGSVIDGDGDPVSEAMVYLFVRSVSRGLYQTELKMQTSTTLSGTFHFGHLSAGTYYVAAAGRPWYAQNQDLTQQQSGSGSDLDVAFPVTYYAGSTSPEAAAPIALEEGAKAEIQFTLNAVPALHVAFDGVERQPDQSIQSSLTQVGPGGTQLNVVSIVTPDGIRGVAPGNYVLSARLFGSNQQSEIGSQTINLAGDSTVHLNEGVKTSISGTVLFDGDVPENLGVWFGNVENGGITFAPLAKSRSFTLPQIQPGRYSLLMGNSNEFYIQKVTVKGGTYVDGILDIAKGAQIELAIAAGKGMTKIDGTVVHGKTPVAGAMVLAIPQDSTRAKYIPRDQSDSDGTFTLYQVPPGRYTLVAIQNGHHLAYAEPGVITPYLPQGQVLDVPLPKDAKVEIEVQPRR
jgi:hypothetical protein